MTGLAVGNTVQYVTEKTDTYAAIIIKILDTNTGCVNLAVFFDDDFFNDGIVEIVRETSRVYSEGNEPGTWHWLPAVD